MKRLFFQLTIIVVSFICSINKSISQVGIANGVIVPHPSAMLDIRSIDKGVLITRLTTAQRLAIVSPATGLLVFDSNTLSFWFYTGSFWRELSITGLGWRINGNSGTDTAIHFIGTTDNMPLRFRINNIPSGEVDAGNGVVALGVAALSSNTTGFSNSAFGIGALRLNTTGNDNSAFGSYALFNSVSGNANSASGQNSLLSNTTGSANTAQGASALRNNISGYSNTGIGVTALFNNTVGHNLVAVGDSSLYFNGVGVTQAYHAIENTAIGSKALLNNTIGYFNTASGFRALYSNTTGAANSAHGDAALYYNTIGSENIASGYASLFSNINGNNNIATGFYALASNISGSDNIAIGKNALLTNQTGNKLVAIGDSALYFNSTGYSNIAIGSKALYFNSTGIQNSAAGFQALDSNTTGSLNSGFGAYSLLSSKDGIANSAFGSTALASNTSGDHNTGAGQGSLFANTTGTSNSGIGSTSLRYNTTGNGNTGIGAAALITNITGSHNTSLGYYADVEFDNLLNATAIGAEARVSSNNSIVLGSILGVNGATASVNVGIGTTIPVAPFHVRANSASGFPQILVEENSDDYARVTFKTTANPTKFWDVAAITKPVNANAEFNFFYGGFGNVLVLKGNGNATLTGTLTQLSDSRLKTNIFPLQNSLSNVLKLNGYSYKWKDNNKDSSEQIGVIAQEVQKLFPQLVSTDENGLLSVNYSGLVPVLISAIKEQQKIIDSMKQENMVIKDQLLIIKKKLGID